MCNLAWFALGYDSDWADCSAASDHLRVFTVKCDSLSDVACAAELQEELLFYLRPHTLRAAPVCVQPQTQKNEEVRQKAAAYTEPAAERS